MSCSDLFGDTFCTIIIDWWSFLWWLIKFIVFWLKTLLNFVRKAFTYIFSEDLFNSIWDTFTNLSVLMGSTSTIILMSLFFLAFILIIISFIFKLIKWQVNYRATIKKFVKK